MFLGIHHKTVKEYMQSVSIKSAKKTQGRCLFLEIIGSRVYLIICKTCCAHHRGST